jgi:DNA-binding NtrC family response regulator
MDRSIVIVDDDRAIVDVLAEEGYQVRKSYDGLAALALATLAPPALVLSDSAMPPLNGIPVVLLSAVVVDPRIPGVPSLPKPFDRDRIVAIVANLVGTPADAPPAGPGRLSARSGSQPSGGRSPPIRSSRTLKKKGIVFLSPIAPAPASPAW